MSKSETIKFVTCQHCNEPDMHWEQINGRWVMMESHGLPHCCPVREQQRKDASEAKKAQYREAKAKVEAITDGSDCKACINGVMPGILLNSSRFNTCRHCNGRGKIDAETKKRMLYQLRKSIWPNMFNKR